MTSAPIRDNYLNIDGINLYYEFINKSMLSEGKPLLVFLHEGLGCSKQWKDFPLLLSDATKLPALLYDRYGYGMSDCLKSDRNKEFMHHEALEVLPEIFFKLNLPDHQKILLGHSDGGSIAIIHAGSFPEKIKGIITEAAHLYLEDISYKGIRDAIVAFETGELKKLLSKYHGENTEKMFYGWTDNWLSEDLKDWNIESYLSHIRSPFLAIQGENDNYGTISQLQSIQKYLKENVIIEHIPECGHIPHLQAKKLVLKKMTEFISKI